MQLIRTTVVLFNLVAFIAVVILFVNSVKAGEGFFRSLLLAFLLEFALALLIKLIFLPIILIVNRNE